MNKLKLSALALALVSTSALADSTYITSSVLWPSTSYAMNNTTVDGRLTAGNVRTNSIYMDTASGGAISLGGTTATFGSNVRINHGGGLVVEGSTMLLGGLNNNNMTITGVANGVNATDAVNVRQLNAEATARINGDVNTLNQANTYTNTQVTNAVSQANNYTDNRVNAETQRAMQAEHELSNHINAVGAMAMAVGSMPRTMYNPDRKSRLNLGIGNYGNASALAVGLSHDFNDRISGNLNVAQSITGSGNSGVGAGLSIGF
jgi:autotransporter adhesin